MSTFGISVGSSIDNPASVTTIVTNEPHVLPAFVAPLLGANARRAMSGKLRRDGAISHQWTWDFISWVDYRLLIDTIWGGASIASIDVTIRTQDENNRWSLFNCTAYRPYPQQGFDALRQGQWLTNVIIQFHDLQFLGALFELETDEDYLLLETGDFLLLEKS